jgi:hypothetical protein
LRTILRGQLGATDVTDDSAVLRDAEQQSVAKPIHGSS